MFYVNCTHGLIRGIKYYKGQQAIFETTNDLRTAKVWSDPDSARKWMDETCLYVGHYTILTPVLMGDRVGHGDQVRPSLTEQAMDKDYYGSKI